jgi:small membrane protein
MRLFQIIALPFIAVMLALSIRNLFKTPARLAATLFWVVLWLATLVAVMYPDSTTRLARTLGIYRGADLLVYSAVIAFIVAFYVVSLRLRHISRELTVLTREVALLNAERTKDSPPGRPT